MLVLFIFLFCQFAFSVDLPPDLKKFIETKFPNVVFKIDNSFEINKELFIPLVPQATTQTEEIEIVYVIPGKNIPKLFWFSNGWIFVKLIKKSNGTSTILDLKEIPEHYKERFLKSKFPSDLVVPEGFTLKEGLSSLVGELPIRIERNGGTATGRNGETEQKIRQETTPENTKQGVMQGTLYLTSPDTGKIVFLDLSDVSMVSYIQTDGAPLELSFDKTNNLLFVTDFAKDKIYKLHLLEKSIFQTTELTSMSSPRDIKLSEDGSLIYVLESLANDFLVYNAKEEKPFVKTKLPPNPNNFSILNEVSLIAITCPSTNRVVFLNSKDFTRDTQVIIPGGPEKIISDPLRGVFYIANRNADNISVVDGSTKKVKSTIQVGEKPVSLVLNPNGKWLYVGNGKSNTISIVDLDTEQLVDTINLPIETQFPGDIKLTSDGKSLIVTSETTNTISIIDLTINKVALKLDVGVTTHGAYLVDRDSKIKESEKNK